MKPGSEIEQLIHLLAKLPGLGPRSARRAVLAMMARRETLLAPLAQAVQRLSDNVTQCQECGNLDTTPLCSICADLGRDASLLCVVEQVSDLWAVERTRAFKGRYFVLGGVLSALQGIGPDQLRIPQIATRAMNRQITEVVLALSVTVDGQTTAHVIAETLEACGVRVSRLAHGVPMGGELDYLDDGTIATALSARLTVREGVVRELA